MSKAKIEIDEDENEDELKVKKGKRGRKKSENITQCIEIDENFRIKLDVRNFTLQSKYALDNSEDKLDDDEEDNKDGWKTLGYYGDVIGCLKGLIKSKTLNEIKLTKKQSITFQEYYDVLFKVNKETTNMIKIVQDKYDKL